MANIFSPWNLGGLTLPNRLVRSATWEGLADEQGVPKHEMINLTADLAERQVGLITTGYCYVRPDGKSSPGQTGVHIDAMVGPLARVSDAVHKAGGRVAMQIVHGGGQTWARMTGSQPKGPSAIEHPYTKEKVHQLSLQEIAELVEAFAAGAARAQAAGFDAVELHGAHGYLISQFLSPNTNQRKDAYGGDIQGRARFCLEVYRAARRAVGPAFPVYIKLNSDDGLDGGLKLADTVAVAKMLDQAGIDAIEVSGGVPAAGKKSPARVVKGPSGEGYFLSNACMVKAAVSCPVLVVGGMRSREVVEYALEYVDAVSLCRPFIREPNLAQRWANGDRSPATCISCNKCFGITGKTGLACGYQPGDEAGEGAWVEFE